MHTLNSQHSPWIHNSCESLTPTKSSEDFKYEYFEDEVDSPDVIHPNWSESNTCTPTMQQTGIQQQVNIELDTSEFGLDDSIGKNETQNTSPYIDLRSSECVKDKAFNTFLGFGIVKLKKELVGDEMN